MAELNIEIESLYGRVHELCDDYIVDGVCFNFSVKTDQANIDFERRKSDREKQLEGKDNVYYSDAYLETLAVYRKIAEKMPFYDGMLFHGSCVSVDGVGYLFTAKSGTGKSTHTGLWRKLLGDRAVMVNDDKPLIRFKDGIPMIYGTPWDGKHRLSNNISVPLKALCVMERAEKNSIRRVSAYEAYPMLLQQVYRPMDSEAMKKTIELIDRLAASMSLWRLGCNMDIEAAKIAYDAMEAETNEVK